MQLSLLTEARGLDTRRILLNPPPLPDQGVCSDSDNGRKRTASGDKFPPVHVPYTILWVQKENPSTEKRETVDQDLRDVNVFFGYGGCAGFPQ